MYNNDELIELLKRMHDILHQAYETEQGNVTDNLPAELSTNATYFTYASCCSCSCYGSDPWH